MLAYIWSFVNFPKVVSCRRSNLEAPSLQLALSTLNVHTRHFYIDEELFRERNLVLESNFNALFFCIRAREIRKKFYKYVRVGTHHNVYKFLFSRALTDLF